MSVLVTMRVSGDTAKFREYVEQNPDHLRQISEDARSRGCLAHRFGVGDGFVFVVDEWESAQAFQGFFNGNQEVAKVMEASGAQGEPEFIFSEAISTADQF
jgi:heme-degrading monooxygenase HmoA